MVKILLLAVPVLCIIILIQIVVRPTFSKVSSCYHTFETEHASLNRAVTRTTTSTTIYCENAKKAFDEFDQCFVSIPDTLFLKEIVFDLTQEHNILAQKSILHNYRCTRNHVFPYDRSVLGEIFRLTLDL